LNAS